MKPLVKDWLTDYELDIAKLDVYPPRAAMDGYAEDWYYGLGVAGEGGEVADKIKKERRDGVDLTEGLMLEAGDTLWYLCRLINSRGYSLVEVMDMNIKKLKDRHARGTHRGSGDQR